MGSEELQKPLLHPLETNEALERLVRFLHAQIKGWQSGACPWGQNRCSRSFLSRPTRVRDQDRCTLGSNTGLSG